MLQKKGIKYKILLNSFISILIFSIFLVWLSFTYWNLLLNSKKEKLQSILNLRKSNASQPHKNKKNYSRKQKHKNKIVDE